MALRHWFISGMNGGLGLAIARHVLDQGGTVSGTVRSQEAAEQVSIALDREIQTFTLDAASAAAERLPDVIQHQLTQSDVLINNIGVGFEGAVEETSVDELKSMLETNFFSAVGLTRAVLPAMRTRGQGAIVNISSIAGLIGFPFHSAYSISKFALEAFTESLAAEVTQLGLVVMLVEPGALRTSFFGSSHRSAEMRIDAYRAAREARARRVAELDGKQAGDPAKVAAAIATALQSEGPPLRLILGRDALGAAEANLAKRVGELKAWRALAEVAIEE